MASNHKEVFRLYGVRRPLKWRRRFARRTRRLVSMFMKKNRQLQRGSHNRWINEGCAAIWLAENRGPK